MSRPRYRRWRIRPLQACGLLVIGVVGMATLVVGLVELAVGQAGVMTAAKALLLLGLGGLLYWLEVNRLD